MSIFDHLKEFVNVEWKYHKTKKSFFNAQQNINKELIDLGNTIVKDDIHHDSFNTAVDQLNSVDHSVKEIDDKIHRLELDIKNEEAQLEVERKNSEQKIIELEGLIKQQEERLEPVNEKKKKIITDLHEFQNKKDSLKKELNSAKSKIEDIQSEKKELPEEEAQDQITPIEVEERNIEKEIQNHEIQINNLNQELNIVNQEITQPEEEIKRLTVEVENIKYEKKTKEKDITKKRQELDKALLNEKKGKDSISTKKIIPLKDIGKLAYEAELLNPNTDAIMENLKQFYIKKEEFNNELIEMTALLSTQHLKDAKKIMQFALAGMAGIILILFIASLFN